jgi:hypothetical protein
VSSRKPLKLSKALSQLISAISVKVFALERIERRVRTQDECRRLPTKCRKHGVGELPDGWSEHDMSAPLSPE